MISLTSRRSKALFGGLFLLSATAFADVENPPACDTIITNGQNAISIINSGGGPVYCLSPGSYQAGDINVGGTSSTHKVLRYYDGVDENATIVNPVHVSESQRAKFTNDGLIIYGSYWDIYGITFTRANPSGSSLIEPRASNIKMDTILAERGGSAIVRLWTNGGLYNSVVRDSRDASGDEHCVLVSQNQNNVEIIGNEIYDCAGDNIQVHNYNTHIENILIQDNDLYQSGPETDWTCSGCSEQLLDSKPTYGDTIDRGLRVIGNRFYTYGNRPLAQVFSFQGTGAVLFENNVFHNVGAAMKSASPSPIDGTTIRGNLLADSSNEGFLLGNARTSEIYFNTIIGSSVWISDTSSSNATNMDVLCNVVINSGYDAFGSGTVADYNAYYNSSQYAAPGTHDLVYGQSSAANNTQFCYDRRQITNPDRTCISLAKTAASSPHANLCSGVQVGSRAGIGMDNNVFTRSAAGIYMLETIHQVDNEVSPPAELTISGPASGEAGQALSYSATATNCTPDVNGWLWQMPGGDPTSSQQPTISVTYPTEGTRTITVTNSACSGAEGLFNVDISGAPLVRTECGQIDSNSASLPFQEQSPPWNVFDTVNDPKQNLIDVECVSDGTVDIWAGNSANPNMYVWHQALVKLDNGPWAYHQLQGGSTHPQSSNWFQGRASLADIAVDVTTQESPANYVAAYICQWRDNGWKCGCETAAGCEQTGLWSVQRFQEGGTTPVPALTVNGPANTTVNTATAYSASATNCTVNPAGWSWSMPGGTPASATTESISVSYASSGDKSISVTNTGCAGATGTKTVTVTTPAQASLTISGPLSGITDETLNYTAAAANCTPLAGGWTWTATGGTPSSGTSASFATSYSTTGTKQITVTNTACSGAEGSATVTISSPGGGAPFTSKPTYESIGVYWTPNGGGGSAGSMSYREDGASTWIQAHPLTWDSHAGEYRASIVDLTAGTTYNVRLQNSNETRTQNVTTWTPTDQLPIGTTTNLSASSSTPVTVSQSGTASGYHLVTGPAGGGIATIDPNYNNDTCMTINADYVIVRGIRCDRARINGIVIPNGRHHIVFEDSQVVRWGDGDTGNGNSAAFKMGNHASTNQNHHITIQRNWFDDARNGVAPVASGNDNRAQGAYALRWYNMENGQIVIADNTFTTPTRTSGYYWDHISGGDNRSDIGFPGPDSDVLRNYFRGAVDDCMEIEGGGRNVRIARNWTQDCMVQIGIGAVQVGPLYMWRNVTGTGRYGWNNYIGSGITKWSGNNTSTGRHGMVYSYHNSFISHKDPNRITKSDVTYGWGGEVRHLVSKNNILTSNNKIIRTGTCYDPEDIVDNDLLWDATAGDANCNQAFDTINATPSFQDGPDWQPQPGVPAHYELASSSRGRDEAVAIPGFDLSGNDIGADEADGTGMTFGVLPKEYPTGWTDEGVVLSQGGGGSWDVRFQGALNPAAAVLHDGTFYLYYVGADGDRSTDGGPRHRALGVATSTDGVNFTKYGGNPIIEWLPNNNEEEGAFSGTVIVKDDVFYLYYAAVESINPTSETVHSSVRLATSSNGLDFTDQGEVLDWNDSNVYGYGDELFPVGSYYKDGQWNVYYIARSAGFDWHLAVAYGNAADNLNNSRDVENISGRYYDTEVFEGHNGMAILISSRDSNVDFSLREIPTASSPHLVGNELKTYNHPDLIALIYDPTTAKYWLYNRDDALEEGISLSTFQAGSQ